MEIEHSYRMDREIARTVAARIMADWIKDDRSPTVMGLTIVRLHALLLVAAPPEAREDGIECYVDALQGMIAEIEASGP